MAKNISLLGADYPDVPAVVLPKTGGGSAIFVDPDEIGLKSGANNIGNIICAGYNTGSGNYVAVFIPINTNGKTIISASASADSCVFTPSGRVDFSNAPSISILGYSDFGVRAEITYPSTQGANVNASVYFVNLQITCA